MTDPSSTSVQVIESIGPRTVERLEAAGVRVVADLQRVPARIVHRAVADLASPAQVAAWRQMAYLLLIRPVDGQWAEALREGGVSSIEELAVARWSDLRELFTEAHDAGRIPDEPVDGELADMLRDAKELTLSGHTCGRVVDRDGQPVGGAEVRIGGVSAVTDERGRFHLWRVPRATGAPLEVSAADARFVFEDPPVADDLYLVDERTWTLEQPVEEAGGGEPVPLGELDGDDLPIVPGAPTRVRHLPPGVLRERDVLRVQSIDEEDGTVELVSRYRSWEQGTVVVHPVRLSVEELPPGAGVGTHCHVRAGELRAIRIDPRSLFQLRAGRRAAAALESPTAADSASELAARVRETLPALVPPEDEELYLWDSFDGCPRCQALSGLYVGSPPARPHPMCRCDIVRLGASPRWQETVHCFRVSLGEVRAGDDAEREPGAAFSLVYRYRGDCVDGGEHDGEVELEQSWDAWHDFDADEATFGRGYDLALLAALARIGEELERACDCAVST